MLVKNVLKKVHKSLKKCKKILTKGNKTNIIPNIAKAL